jgi:hypothetical protein
MSLINDALKRAKEAQDKPEQAPPPDLKLRPVDSKEASPSGRPAWLLPSLITAAVLATIFVVWQFKPGNQHPEKSGSPGQQNSDNKTSATLPGGSLKVHAREQEVAVLPKGVGPVDTDKVAIVAVSATTIQETTRGQGTNSNLPADGLTRPTGPRLQGIIFVPSNPSATISGKNVFVGEKFGQWRVAAIGRDSATLVGGGETNVLKLGE